MVGSICYKTSTLREGEKEVNFCRPSHREDKEIKSIKGKIESLAEALKKLQVHVDDGTCPRTLRYNARANIAVDRVLEGGQLQYGRKGRVR